MKLVWLIFIVNISLIADYKPTPSDNLYTNKEASNINVNFTMGNSQEVPTQNSATSTTKRIHVEHKMEPLPQESMFSKIKNSFVVGAAGALGSIAVNKILENSETIVEFLKKIILRG